MIPSIPGVDDQKEYRKKSVSPRWSWVVRAEGIIDGVPS
jgi:hypothetical protein